MGDDEDRAAARREVAREPVDALDVEVVGRLVEQQQLGVAEQRLRQRDPAPLAARQRRDRRVQPLREAADLDAAEQPVEHGAVGGVGHPLVVGAAADELLADRARRVEVVALAEHRHVQPAGARDRARVGLLEPRDQLQQRRLAVAVAADDADPVPGRDAERDVLQHGPRGVALGGVLEVDEVARRGHCGSCSLRSSRWRQLEDEQEHLDATGAAYDRAFAALVGRKPPSGSDDYANEALEQMRRERIRVYTEASGPLYFGRVDEADGETLYVGRHAVWSAGQRAALGQLARARGGAVLQRHRARAEGRAGAAGGWTSRTGACSGSSTRRWRPRTTTT